MSTATASAAAALQSALSAEHAAVYGYGVVGAMLAGPAPASTAQTSTAPSTTAQTGTAPTSTALVRSRACWLAHQVARDTLEAMLTKLGATPVAASPAYQLPFPVNSAASAVRLAVALENGVTRAYLGVVAVSDPALRSFGALAMQTAAGQAATWSGTTQAFPGLLAAQS